VGFRDAGARSSFDAKGLDKKEAGRSRSSLDWAADDHVPVCPQCQASFSMTFRRHHCRRCLGLVCRNCSSSRLHLGVHQGSVRVCDQCVTAMKVELGKAESLDDLEESLAITKQLSSSLEDGITAIDNYKSELVAFAIEAAGNVQQPSQYPGGSHGAPLSFDALRDGMRPIWEELLAAAGDSYEQSVLKQRLRQARLKLDEVAKLEGRSRGVDEYPPTELKHAVRDARRQLELLRGDWESCHSRRKEASWCSAVDAARVADWAMPPPSASSGSMAASPCVPVREPLRLEVCLSRSVQCFGIWWAQRARPLEI